MQPGPIQGDVQHGAEGEVCHLLMEDVIMITSCMEQAEEEAQSTAPDKVHGMSVPYLTPDYSLSTVRVLMVCH